MFVVTLVVVLHGLAEGTTYSAKWILINQALFKSVFVKRNYLEPLRAFMPASANIHIDRYLCTCLHPCPHTCAHIFLN